MDEALVGERLARIEALGRSGPSRAELLEELRVLVHHVELPVARGGEGEEVVERLHRAPHGT